MLFVASNWSHIISDNQNIQYIMKLNQRTIELMGAGTYACDIGLLYFKVMKENA